MKKDYIKYVLALLLFGSNGIVANQIALSSVGIVFWRTLIGSLLLIILFFIGKEKFTFWKRKKEFFAIAMSGVAMGASWMFLYEAYQQVGVGIASLCYYCGPIIVMLLSPIIFHERLTREKIAGFIIVLLGIILINRELLSADSGIGGLVCGMMSAVMYSLMVIFNKKAEHITGLENSMLQLVFSFLTVAGFAGLRHSLVMPAGDDLLPILILGVLNTGIGCYFYFSSIGKLPIQTVAVCGYLEPLSAVIFAAIFLKEIMSIPQAIGAVLIIGGMVFSENFS
ncbi:MAG: DMT family transporter [Clostridium sp.]|nr:DMT family transporter [Clostridium sp.]